MFTNIKTFILNKINRIRINHDARLIDYIKQLILQQINNNNDSRETIIDTQYIIRKCIRRGYSKHKVILMINYIDFILNNYIPHKK